MSNQNLTVGQLLEMQPGDQQNTTWINDDFEAVVTIEKAGQGRAPTVALLSDPHNQGICISASCFRQDMQQYNGNLCHFSGQGMTRTEYKGKQQVTIGNKATIQKVGRVTQQTNTQQASSAPPPQVSAIHPASVGMAIKEALQMVGRGDYGALQPDSPEFWATVHESASDIIRVSAMLEKGKLARPIRERTDPEFMEKQEAAAREKAEAEAEAARKAKEQAEMEANIAPSDGSDEDVPF